jgi:hypothetical protein
VAIPSPLLPVGTPSLTRAGSLAEPWGSSLCSPRRRIPSVGGHRSMAVATDPTSKTLPPPPDTACSCMTRSPPLTASRDRPKARKKPRVPEGLRLRGPHVFDRRGSRRALQQESYPTTPARRTLLVEQTWSGVAFHAPDRGMRARETNCQGPRSLRPSPCASSVGNLGTEPLGMSDKQGFRGRPTRAESLGSRLIPLLPGSESLASFACPRASPRHPTHETRRTLSLSVTRSTPGSSH